MSELSWDPGLPVCLLSRAKWALRACAGYLCVFRERDVHFTSGCLTSGMSLGFLASVSLSIKWG